MGSRHHRASLRAIAAVAAASLAIAACSSDDNASDDDASGDSTPVTDATEAPSTEPATEEPPATDPPETETPTTEAVSDAPAITEDRSYYILPPGNYGGLPKTDESTDQLALYDGLTPLRDEVTDEDIESLFLPQDFEPIGETTEEPTGRPGTTVLYDEFGIAHITGETREDMAFGAGWVTARDRGLLFELGRGPARAAVADVPGIDAFELVTSGQTFTPSAATEQLVTDQIQVILDEYGEEGEEIISDAQAYADGVTAYYEANDIDSRSGDRQRRHRHDRIHRVDLRGGRRGRGAQRRVPVGAPEPAGRRAGAAGLGGPDARQRPRGARPRSRTASSTPP